jgi:hypothetical protein
MHRNIGREADGTTFWQSRGERCAALLKLRQEGARLPESAVATAAAAAGFPRLAPLC